jgi:hypothetical protein
MEQGLTAVRTDHWRYGKLYEVRVEGHRVLMRAGAGFDSEYELNLRRPTLKEKASKIVRAVTGRSDLRRCRKAHETLWSVPSAAAESPDRIIAQYHMRLIQPHHAHTYLEIGAGIGYLAALAREAWQARMIIVDLSEILPLGFLYLHTRFLVLTAGRVRRGGFHFPYERRRHCGRRRPPGREHRFVRPDDPRFEGTSTSCAAYSSPYFRPIFDHALRQFLPV